MPAPSQNWGNGQSMACNESECAGCGCQENLGSEMQGFSARGAPTAVALWQLRRVGAFHAFALARQQLLCGGSTASLTSPLPSKLPAQPLASAASEPGMHSRPCCRRRHIWASALGHATAEAAASASLAAHHLVLGRLLVEALHILHVIVCRGRVEQQSLWAASLSPRGQCGTCAWPAVPGNSSSGGGGSNLLSAPQPSPAATHSSPWPSPLYMLRGGGRQQQQQRSLAVPSFRVHPAAEQHDAN